MSTNRNVERGRATREQVLEIATRLFAERGYEETSIELVLQESGVSRGSLYHHFKGKEALFEAVVEAVELENGRLLRAAIAGAPDIVAVLRAGCRMWIRLSGDPVVQRILLVDAPSVLGWKRWREMEERHALGMLRTSMRAAADAGLLEPELVDVMAHVWLATLNEIALYIARAEDGEAAMRDGEAAVDKLLERLIARPLP
jgi:AcrR family transcriptional regulator